MVVWNTRCAAISCGTRIRSGSTRFARGAPAATDPSRTAATRYLVAIPRPKYTVSLPVITPMAPRAITAPVTSGMSRPSGRPLRRRSSASAIEPAVAIATAHRSPATRLTARNSSTGAADCKESPLGTAEPGWPSARITGVTVSAHGRSGLLTNCCVSADSLAWKGGVRSRPNTVSQCNCNIRNVCIRVEGVHRYQPQSLETSRSTKRVATFDWRGAGNEKS